jgi:hypothetical protein
MASFLILLIILVQIINETQSMELLIIDNSRCKDFDFYAKELKDVCAISFGMTNCGTFNYQSRPSTRIWKANYKGENTNEIAYSYDYDSHEGGHIRSLIVGPDCKFTTLKVSCV